MAVEQSPKDDGEKIGSIAEEARPPGHTAEPSANRVVWDLAWPAIALNSLQVFNSLLDRKFLGMLGEDSLSASGAAINVTFLLISLAISLGAGTTALVSRFFGAGEHESMIDASRQSTTLALVVGVTLAILGAVFTPAMASIFLRPEHHAFSEAVHYLLPIMVGVPALYVFNTLAASLRAVGDTRTPMVVSGFQILLHICLNYILIFEPHTVHIFGNPVHMFGAGMGIAGAGWAFSISAWVAAILYFPASGRSVLGATWKLQWLRWNWVVRIVRIAFPASVASLIRVTSFGAFSAAFKHMEGGISALGALSVGVAMEGFAFMPAFGYMIAASALVGQSLGKRDPDRAERIAWAATNQAILIMSAMAILFLAFAPQLASVFVENPEQRAAAINYLRIIALTEPFFGYAMVLTGAHQGAGDTIRPTWVAFVSSWLIRVPAVWIIAVYLGGGSTAAWWVMAVTQLFNGVLMIFLFKQGKWKEQQV